MNNKVGENRNDSQQQPEDYNLHVDSDHDSQLVTTDDARKKVSSRGILAKLNQAEMEWLLVAYAVDRLAIAFYFLAFAIMMMTYV